MMFICCGVCVWGKGRNSCCWHRGFNDNLLILRSFADRGSSGSKGPDAGIEPCSHAAMHYYNAFIRACNGNEKD